MSAVTDYKLFTPLTIGKVLQLKNRVVFSHRSRARADKETRNPTEVNQIYYEKRAGAGLIITEATAISEQGFGWYGAPALYTETHATEWKKVTGRVHAKGGKVFLQLWHMGRQAHSSFNPKNEIVAPSAIAVPGGQLRNNKGEHVSYEVPHALETDEIPGIVGDYRKSAALAKTADLDGVEIHAANGYLIDTFLQSSTNTRTDKYGGSFENLTRFLLEVVEAIKQEWSSDRIGVRLVPNGAFAGVGSPDNYEQFIYTAEQLGKHDLGYVAVLDGFGFGYHGEGRVVTAFDTKRAFKGTVIGQNSYTRDTAEGAVRSGALDAVGFGRPYISNPDLAQRFQNDWPLNEIADYAFWWTAEKGAEGYISFPAYAAPEIK